MRAKLNTILVYVQHLLGVGHLHRTALITRALSRAGFDVTVVSGGVPEASIDFGQVKFVQLQAIKTDSAFKALYDKQGNVIDDDFKHARKLQLISVVDQVKPELVIIETYPFGRRQMRFELLPLLEHLRYAMQYRPVIASSIRDVIQPKSNPKRSQEVVSIVDEFFDAIIVHGDDSFIAFEQTFPEATKFKEKLIYSGYVVKQLSNKLSSKREKNTILVSAGGGAVGQQIYTAVIDASKNSFGKQYNWHMLVGNNFSATEFDKLIQHQHKRLLIERNRDDFLQLLLRCSMSVSQAGYNTMMDLLVTDTPALVIPFEGVAEQEQLIRANMFEQFKIVKVLNEKNLNGLNLLEAMKEIIIKPETKLQLNLNGAEQMVEIISKKLLF